MLSTMLDTLHQLLRTLTTGQGGRSEDAHCIDEETEAAGSQLMCQGRTGQKWQNRGPNRAHLCLLGEGRFYFLASKF